jgi:hypothetical protein
VYETQYHTVQVPRMTQEIQQVTTNYEGSAATIKQG